MGNYIYVPRSIFDDESLDDARFSRREAFLYLVQRATYEQEKTVSVKGGRVTLKRGQMIFSLRKLADKWGWGKDKVAKTLADFEAERRIDILRDSLISIISIVNYDLYQGGADSNAPIGADTTPPTSADTNKDADKDGIKNSKEGKEIRREEEKKPSNDGKEKTKRFVPPSVEDVRAFCEEKGYAIDAEYFVNYYEQGGWVYGKSRIPMKSWKAAVSQWAARDKERQSSALQAPTPPPAPIRRASGQVSGFKIASGGGLLDGIEY